MIPYYSRFNLDRTRRDNQAASSSLFPHDRSLQEETMSSQVVTLTEANFADEVLASDQPVVVDFWAPWCGPCRMLSPMVEKLASQFAGQAKVGKLNIDEHPETATQYGIEAIPTLVFFKQGQVVDRITGVVPQKVMDEKLNTLVQQNNLLPEQAA
jgi:thioredoxin 1